MILLLVDAFKISGFSSLFESVMGISFALFALIIKRSAVVRILELPVRQTIDSLRKSIKRLEKQIERSGEDPKQALFRIDLTKKITNSSIEITKVEGTLDKLHVRMRYNFLCLGIYCFVMLLCCALEEYIPTEKRYLQNFIFNYTVFTILFFYFKEFVAGFQEEDKKLRNEFFKYLGALGISILFTFCTPEYSYTPAWLIYGMFITALLLPSALHYYIYNRELKKLNAQLKKSWPVTEAEPSESESD
ncbi:MAG: hypothetical protein AAF990_04155 [Bacteroidota bacterium]